jgi:saccharopine dehydrogenase (NAD+, L-lysine forming)
MNRSATFGVIGSGNTAKAVSQELRRSTGKSILIGGRNLANAEAIASDLGPAGSAVRVDVRDSPSLEQFCDRCSIVVNCGGPVCELQDLVARAALRARSHYVDVAGLTFVRERMIPHHSQAAEAGLSCVVSAGWFPGMSELLPAYALAVARTSMDVVQSVTIHFGDSGEWSNSALRDAVWYLRNFGRRRPSYLRNGKWVRARLSEVLVEKNIGSPMGCCVFTLSQFPEMADLMGRLRDCDASAYTYLPSRRTALTGSLIALLPMPEDLAVRILGPALCARSLPVGGFNVVEIQGRCGSREVSRRHQLTFERHREYWMNAVVAATVARLISEGCGVKPGVYFLVDAVDPIAFMEELRRAGVTDTESFSPANK